MTATKTIKAITTKAYKTKTSDAHATEVRVKSKISIKVLKDSYDSNV